MEVVRAYADTYQVASPEAYGDDEKKVARKVQNESEVQVQVTTKALVSIKSIMFFVQLSQLKT